MWSGPRNISTAMLRSWGNRPDTAVTDEPLYAHYLAATGADHPGRDEVLAAQETDWRRVVEALTDGPVPGGEPVWYQKHMAHHLTPEIDRSWTDRLANAFLIRDPREVILSFTKIVADPAPEELGFPQQAELFERVRRTTGRTPPVVDARDVLLDPPGTLGRLCSALGVAFDPRMLAWPPGRRATDGVWAPYWYAAVERSTGFAPYRRRDGELPERLRPVYEACLPHYESLAAHRL